MIGHFLFIVAVSIAIGTISYPGFARAKRWPIGSILASGVSAPQVISFIAVAWALGKAFIMFQWWSPIVVLLVGWLLALVLTLTFRKNTQILCILGAFPAYALIVLYQSEQRPFGVLHGLF